MKKIILFLMVLIGTISFGKGEEKIKVFTSILPQKYFVEKIGGDRVDVRVLVAPGKSPATYSPTPNQVIDLSSAKVLFTIGVPFENAFLDKVRSNLKTTEIVDTSYGIKKRELEAHSHGDDHHDDHHNDHHEGHHDHDHHDAHGSMEDPHVWMSPVLVKHQGKIIYETLAKVDPQGKEEYLKGYEGLVKEMDELDGYVKDKLTPYKGNTVFVYHPAFGYFTDEYGLYQEAIETGGKEPKPATLEKIIEEAKKDNVKIIFVQPEFSQKSANAIANAIDGKVVTLNPLNPDYVNNMKRMADEIQGAFKGE